jgi:hypothetical protein
MAEENQRQEGSGIGKNYLNPQIAWGEKSLLGYLIFELNGSEAKGTGMCPWEARLTVHSLRDSKEKFSFRQYCFPLSVEGKFVGEVTNPKWVEDTRTTLIYSLGQIEEKKKQLEARHALIDKLNPLVDDLKQTLEDNSR